MSYCTAINCIDGRTQLPVISYLKQRFDVEYVDIISGPGPNLLLAKGEDSSAVDLLLKGIQVSVDHHHSIGIAVVGHHDCAANPASREEQQLHLQ
ncbi:MAG: carbonic anhydrase, partial [Thermodesulfobacteriota bacterium]